MKKKHIVEIARRTREVTEGYTKIMVYWNTETDEPEEVRLIGLHSWLSLNGYTAQEKEKLCAISFRRPHTRRQVEETIKQSIELFKSDPPWKI